MYKLYSLFLVVLVISLCGCRSKDEYLLKQASKGDLNAQIELGMSNFYGSYGHTIDYNKSYAFFHQAAAKKEPIALYHLGEMHELGLGNVELNYDKALAYYSETLKLIQNYRGFFRNRVAFISGKMVYYGRGVKANELKATEFLNIAVRGGILEANSLLAHIYLTSKNPEIKSKSPKALPLLERSSRQKFPIASFDYAKNLELSNPKKANELFKASAKASYPPAIMELASKNMNKIAQKNEWEKAANMGDATALFELAKKANAQDEKNKLLHQAAYRGSLSAIESIANSLENEKKWSKSTIYNIVLNNQTNETSSPSLERLDRASGLLLPMQLLWQNRKVAQLPLLESRLPFYIKGYKANISNLRKNYNDYLSNNAIKSYLNGDWYDIYQANLPLIMAGDIFKHYRKTQKKLDNDYFLNLSIMAGLAGQGNIQLDTANRIKITEDSDAKLAIATLLLRANGLALSGKREDAYEFLFKCFNGAIPSKMTSFAVNFINANTKELLYDAKKLNAATNIPVTLLVAYKKSKVQDFYDYLSDGDMSAVNIPSEPQIID